MAPPLGSAPVGGQEEVTATGLINSWFHTKKGVLQMKAASGDGQRATFYFLEPHSGRLLALRLNEFTYCTRDKSCGRCRAAKEALLKKPSTTRNRWWHRFAR